MIVPRIELKQEVFQTDGWQENLLQEIRHWSIFGGVALTIDAAMAPDAAALLIPSLQKVVKLAAGFADLQIQMASLSDEQALELLNIGASYVLTQHENREHFASVPDDRIRFVDGKLDVESPSPRQLFVESSGKADVAKWIELEMQRIDVCVDAKWLGQNPEAIVDWFCGVLTSDRKDGLWPTVICDSLGIALGLAYSDAESLRHAIEHRQGAYHSRSRGELWVKGATSGATQHLRGIRMDCDRDALRFTVTQDPPGFCHRGTHTCFGEERSIATVVARLKERIESPDEKSFTRKLANDPGMLEKKLLEETGELIEAAAGDDRYEVAWEAADVMYFSLVAMLNKGVSLDEVHAELARRMNRIVRRKNKLES